MIIKVIIIIIIIIIINSVFCISGLSRLKSKAS